MATNISYLNRMDKDELLRRFKNGEGKTLAKELGYSEYKTFLGAMRQKYGAESVTGLSIQPEQATVVNLPPVILREYKPVVKGRGDPETQVLVIGDGHAGEVTPSFNADVYKKRMTELFDATMVITQLHRNMYPLNDLVILDVGDNVHGENPYQGAAVGTISCGAVDQVYDIALPAIVNLLCSFKQEFRTITFVGVRGNHGRIGIACKTSNWDIMLYKSLAKVNLPENISIKYSDDFKALLNIGGFEFFVFHGDQCRATMGIPYFALIKKLMSWSATFNNPNYFICGHFHKEDYLRVSSISKLLINSSLVTDDPYAMEIVGTSSIPSHWTFGVHKNYGITWLYNLVLDKKFLPQRKEKHDAN